MNIQYNIEALIAYGVEKGLLSTWDVIMTRNALLDLLRVEEPYTGEEGIKVPDTPVDVLNEILDYCYEKGLIEENTTTYRDLMDARIMGLLMPRESEVICRFNRAREAQGVEQAVSNFYDMSKNSNYIRMDRIAKNMYWKKPTDIGEIEITINLSKPEKDPKEIAKAKLMPQASYPKCLLCVDNVGYAGRLNHPGRQNHRVLPVTLDHEQWFFQYSPYVYYNEHSIIFKGAHEPMKITGKTFKRLLDFTQTIPHYFIGSNADLPIVGGSILSHDHFQGGNHTFAMEVAPKKLHFTHEKYPQVQGSIVDWAMSVVRLNSEDKDALVALGEEILTAWRGYSDEEVDILAFSTKDGEEVPHNTITPIARKTEEGLYELDLVLRNNRCTEEYPSGLFHPHPHLHHLKKENIGLIEVMGLAVLPGRLKAELELIKEILCGKELENLTAEEKEAVQKHLPWVDELKEAYGEGISMLEATEAVEDEVAKKFAEVLKCAGVYKQDEAGEKAFVRFMEQVGFAKK